MKKIILKYQLLLILCILLPILLFVTYYFIIFNPTKNLTEQHLIHPQNLDNNAVDRLFLDKEPYILDPSINIAEINEEFDNREIYKLIDELVFQKGDTIISLLSERGYKTSISIKLAQAINPIIPSNLIQIGDKIEIYSSKDKKLKDFVLITKNSRIIIRNENDSFVADLISQPGKYEYIYKKFLIKRTLYESSNEHNIPATILEKTIDLHEKKINFDKDIRSGSVAQFYFKDNLNLGRSELRKYQLLYTSLLNNNMKNEFYYFQKTNGKESYYDQNGVAFDSIRIIEPLEKNYVTSKFGLRNHPVSGEKKMHYGIDYSAEVNTPIYAVADGIVDFIGIKGDFGKYIRLSHNNDLESAYAHLSKFAKDLDKGSIVSQSDIIGYTGNTGLSTGPHLHFEIILDQKRIDPEKLHDIIKNNYLENNELDRYLNNKNRIQKEINALDLETISQ
jgi:murein DD-endopeptidase MepM/ murein hydrolase activator NlpD